MTLNLSILLDKLVNEARNSQMPHRIAACLIQNGKFISPPKCNVPRNYCKGNICGSLHAESRAILSTFGNLINWNQKYGWHSRVKSFKLNCDLMVIRIDKKYDTSDDVTLMNARPCYKCLDMMKSLGISRIYYSNDQGEIICEKTKHMISTHTSTASYYIDTRMGKNCRNIEVHSQYQDWVIGRTIPSIINTHIFNNFITYDWINLKSKYTIKQIKKNHNMIIQIINSNNQIIKTFIIV